MVTTPHDGQRLYWKLTRVSTRLTRQYERAISAAGAPGMDYGSGSLVRQSAGCRISRALSGEGASILDGDPSHKVHPDYALSSATEAWYKTGTYGLFLRV
jgi:hypothetical protein